jgi:iron(III) transport system ATP-binding protein
MIVLSAVNLGKTYAGQKTPAVNNLNITVSKGEILALVGESGCGKTTVLRLITGFEIPDTGELFLNGRLISGERIFVQPEKRGIGIVFQDYALFPHKTIAENICFGLFSQKKAEQKKRLKEMLSLTSLEEMGKRYPHELSGGQRQRAALARALAPRPGLILLDEPFSSIDSVLRSQLRKEIREIVKKSEATAIFVTHDTTDVLDISDRAVVLQQGETLQVGSPQEIYRRPANSYVATFFGETNFVKAKPVKTGFLTAQGLISWNSNPYSRNEFVTLSVRPEAYQLTQTEDQSTFSGTIRSRKFFGSHYEFMVEITNNISSKLLKIHLDHDINPASQKCFFRVKPEGVSVIAETT